MTAVGRREEIAGNLDTSMLKLLALILMLTDHMGKMFFSSIPEMRIIGRMAFPLYAWCLVVGCVKTRNPLRYGGRMLALALLSQPLYMMALNHSWNEFNILFTLLIALIAIQGIRMHKFASQFWVPALCYLLLGFVNVDYGWKGFTFILLLYLARESRGGLAAAFLAYALYWGASSSGVTSLFGYSLEFLRWPGVGTVFGAFFRLQGMIWLSLPLIAVSTHSQIRLPHWLGYALYPLHLALLILFRLMDGATFAMLTRGF